MTAFFMLMNNMNKIALIYMGGTFGCIGEPLSPMPESTFIPQLQQLLPTKYQTIVSCFQAASIKDSSACTAQDWLQLIQQIQTLQLQNFQHFIIIHGTDTLSYASAVLAQFLQQSCHVILTGSQFPLLNIEGTALRSKTDALDNLNTSLEAITQIKAGVYLAFHQQVFYAQTAFKVHTTDLNAFNGITIQEEHQDFSSKALLPLHVEMMHIEKANMLNIINWMMLPIEKNQLSQNLKQLLNQVPDFLIIQAYGTGNLAVNDEIINLFQQLRTLGCQTILTTQVLHGGIDQRYAISQWIKETGILLSNSHTQADLYAKILKIYLQYPTSEQWHDHWQ